MGAALDLSMFALHEAPTPLLADDDTPSLATSVLRQPPTDNIDHPIRGEEFLAGPIRMEWLEAAAVLPGAALKVALVIRHLHTMRGRDWVVLSNCAVERLGVSASAKGRAVRALTAVGLIEVQEHRAGCAPRVRPVGDR